MDYSLIVATYNRLDEMKELLASLQQMDAEGISFELVVMDDGSTDGTKEFFTSITLPFPFVYEYQENQGPGPARNAAMNIASGTYMIFMDSDVIVPEDYLREVHKSVTKHHWDAFGGPDDSHPSFSPLLKAINYSMTSFLGTGGTRGSTKSVTKFYPRSFNMGVHQRVVETIGGMGNLRHGQDMDYSARIYQAGFSVGLIPKAKVFHKRRTSLRRFYKQIFNWGVARINLGRSYPEMLKMIHLAPAMLVAFVLLIILLAVFIPIFRWIALLLLMGASVIAALACMQAFMRYKQWNVALLSVVTLFIQVFAYGLGTWSGLLQWLRGKKRARGFTRNYYK